MMAGSGDISNILDSTEFESLSPVVVDKLQKHILSQHSLLDELKTKYERHRVNAEQQYFEIEKKLITTTSKFESESKSCIDLKEQLSGLESKHEECTKKLKGLEDLEQGNLSTQLQLSRTNDQLEIEKRELTVLLEKRNKEIDLLNDEFKGITDKFSAANSAKYEALAKLDEVQSDSVGREYREKRVNQEKDQLQQQLDWSTKELREKQAELLNIRKDKSSKLLEIQSQLDERTEEVRLSQETIEALKKANADQTSRIEGYIQKLKDARDSQMLYDEQFRQELQAQVKLVQLYKASADETENKAGELTRAVQELQKLLKDAAQAYTELEELKEEEEKKYLTEVRVKDERIRKLELETENANELLTAMKSKGIGMFDENMETLFPAASATSKMLKSGMTLTQIYSEYVQVTESLQLEKDENRRLSQYLDQILQEIEEKAPVLTKQRIDYETSLGTVNQMTSQLDGAMLEREKLRSETDDHKRRADQLDRETSRLQQQTVDLGRQVRYLMKEIEEMKGGHVVVSEPDSSSEVSTSAGIISQKLVTFKNIEELQAQNQNLLQVVRDLSDRREEEERLASDSRMVDLKKQLDSALEELEELKAARKRQAEMVESLVRQRDMYRVLLSQTGSAVMLSPVQASTPSHAKPETSQSSEKSAADLNNALKALQVEYITYKREKGENERILNEQLETIRQSSCELRVQNAKLASQLDFAAERYKILQSNADSYRKEITALCDKNQKYNASVVKHEQTINSLRVDMMACQENFTRAEVQCQNLRAERDLLKSVEQHLVQEKETLQRDNRSQNMLMANLREIQNKLERAEFESKSKLGHKLETLEKEEKTLRRRLDTEIDQHKSDVKYWEGRLKEIQTRLETELKTHERTRELHKDAAATVHKLKQEISTSEAKLSAVEMRFSNLSSDPFADQLSSTGGEDEVKDLKFQLKELQAEKQTLKGQLQEAKQHVDQYKAVSEGLENSLREQNEVSKQFKESLEHSMEEMTQATSRMEKQVEVLEEERKELLSENIRITEESHTLNADLRKQLSSMHHELHEAVERRQSAIANEDVARRDYKDQSKIASETQDKYERELMLHAANVQALTAVRKEMNGFNDKLSVAEEGSKRAEENLRSSQLSWNDQQRKLKTESDDIHTKYGELAKQNSLLHEQMEKLSGQVIAIEHHSSHNVPDGATAAMATGSEDGSKSLEQLLEVIRYLRREKDIAETKQEVVQAESSRLRQTVDLNEKLLAEANKNLFEERERTQVNMQTAAQHADLMRKVENLNLLSDSNKLLREERDRLLHQMREAEAKVNKLEEDICPLQANIREVQAQREALTLEKGTLQSEVDRWKARTNHLIEQCNKSDPEEHRKLVQEREEMRKQLAVSTEDFHKQRAEQSRLNMALMTAQREINQGKQEIAKLNDEIAKVTTAAEIKNKDVEEKVKTINQLKKIGRKYKEQAEKVGKELEDVKALSDGTTPVAPSAEAIEQATAAAAEKLGEAEKQCEALRKKAQELETEITALKEQAKTKLEEFSRMQEESGKLKSENNDFEKKNNQSRTLLQSAKVKITNQKEQIEKMAQEKIQRQQEMLGLQQNAEENDLRMKTIKSQLEGRIEKLDQELQAARNEKSQPSAELDRLQKENSELQLRIQLLQKQIESQQQKMTTQLTASRQPPPSGPVERISAITSDSQSPPTANIKPMSTTPGGPIRLAAPIQPVTSPAAAKATASIRPMAIAPATISPLTITTQTPTATVMPTSLSQQEVHEVSPDDQTPPQLSPATITGRPAQQVQIVTPQIEQTQEIVVEPVIPEIPAVVITEPEPAASTSTIAPQIVLPTQQVVPAVIQPTPSATILREPVMVAGTSKRQREDMDNQDELEVKRSKTSEEQQLQIPPLLVTTTEEQPDAGPPLNLDPTPPDSAAEDQPAGETTAEPTQVDSPLVLEETVGDIAVNLTAAAPEAVIAEGDQPEQTEQTTEVKDTVEQTAESAQDPAVAQVAPSTGGTDPPQEDNDDVCIVSSGSDEDAEDYPEEEDEEDDHYDDGMEEYVEDEEIDEEYQEDQEGMDEGPLSGPDEAMQEDVTGVEDDDDVVIVDDEDADSQMEAQPEGDGQPPAQSGATLAVPSAGVVGQRPLALQPLPGHSERIPSVGRAQQFTPFSFGGFNQASAFDDFDDCAVPCTPTLFVSRPTDGFAEAVSSPQVPQSFVFGSGADNTVAQSELARLESQEALGMGDTRMDLSQLDESQGGRSIPTTPLPVVPTVVVEQQASIVPVQEQTIPAELPTVDGSTGEVQDSESPNISALESGSASRELLEEGALLEGDQGTDEEDVDQGDETGDSSEQLNDSQVTSDEVVQEAETGETSGGSFLTEEEKAFAAQTDTTSRPRIQRITWDSPNRQRGGPSHVAEPRDPTRGGMIPRGRPFTRGRGPIIRGRSRGGRGLYRPNMY